MKVNSDLDVSKEEFFEFLYSSIINDVKESTGKTLSKEDIKEGYKYDKNLKTKVGRLGEVKVKLTEFKPYTKYTAEFESNQGKNIISYDIKSLDDKKINVTYREDFVAADKLKALNFKLLNIFYKNRSIKKAEAILKNIENYIKNNRDGEE